LFNLKSDVCSIGLDPDDEDKPDLTVFGGLEMFLDSDMTEDERSHFLEVTTPSMVHKALQLKQLKPAGGLHFSLQQQGERLTWSFLLDFRDFIISIRYCIITGKQHVY
jgi:hypothetical protein